MTSKQIAIAAAVVLSFGSINACPVDSGSGTGARHATATGGKSHAIDSLHFAMKEYRAQQGKKIMELRNKIDAELLTPTPNHRLLAAYVAQQSALRQKIADKWLESILAIKALTKADSYPQYVKGNWGCRCGDSDFGCVPKKEPEVQLEE